MLLDGTAPRRRQPARIAARRRRPNWQLGRIGRADALRARAQRPQCSDQQVDRADDGEDDHEPLEQHLVEPAGEPAADERADDDGGHEHEVQQQAGHR